MAQTEVFFFRDPKDDAVPLLDWLERLPAKVQAKCTQRIDRLGELGHELRRPEADFLRDGIYELRASSRSALPDALLLCWQSRSHCLTKEREVPPHETSLAIERKKKVESDFEQFTFRPEYL